MKKFTIIFDVDDVLLQYSKKCLNEISKKFYIKCNYEESLWGFKNLPNNAVEYLENYIYGNIDFMKDIPINSDIYNLINKLIEDNQDIVFATAVYSNCATYRSEHLQSLFPQIHPKNIIITGRKDLIKGDIIIDDCFNHIKRSICTHKIIFDQPWNRPKKENFESDKDLQYSKELLRAKNGKELEKIIYSLIK